MEGPRAVGAALDHGATLEELFWAAGADAGVVARAAGAGIRTTEVDPEVLAGALSARTPQPLAAVAPWAPVDPATLPEGPVVVLAGVADPGNAGAVIRSAAATGAVGVVLTPGSVDWTNPKCVRASAGACFALPVGVVDDLTALGRPLVGAVLDGDPPDRVDLGRSHALVLGGEAAGLLPDLALDRRVALPLSGGVESLNVAMAATVLLYEARRQRQGGHW